MKKPNMTIQEIEVGLSATIATAAYENVRPSFLLKAQIPTGQSAYDCVVYLQNELHKLMKEEEYRNKAEAIERMYSMIRMYEKGNKKYPSVTSILGWDKDWYGMTEDDLQQYASRGNVLEWLCQNYIEKKEWVDPNDVPKLQEDLTILKRGTRQLSWEDGSHFSFMEKFAEKIEVESFQKTVYNDEHSYAGTPDILGKFDGKRSVMDFKSGSYDMRQLAAYAIAQGNIEQLVVLPIGPTENKCGYKKPVICETIDVEFKHFLKARAKFKSRYGI